MESEHIELSEFTVNAKPKSAREIFEEALESFNRKVYEKQTFIANYEEFNIIDKKDTSYLRANCVVANYTPKEKSGLIVSKRYIEKVALLSVDSIQNNLPNNAELRKKNHLLLMNRLTKINNLARFYKKNDFEITDTTINKNNQVVFKLLQYYKGSKTLALTAIINVTEKRFLQLTSYLSGKKEDPSYYRAIFSDYIDAGLPTRIEMRITDDFYKLKSLDKGGYLETSLTLHEKVTIPVKTESWVNGTLFEAEIDLELKEKLGY